MATAWDRLDNTATISSRKGTRPAWPAKGANGGVARRVLTRQTGKPDGKVIAVGNLKGGTGKSTLAVNLAGVLASDGKRVCVVDCDPQATSSSWMGHGHIGAVCEVMPANGVGEVANWLNGVADKVGRYDVVIVDLPSVLTPALASAFLLAHLILIPVSTSSLDLHGTRRVMRHIRTVREERVQALPKVLLVPTRVPEDQLAQVTLKRIFAEFPERIGPPLRERNAFKKAFAEGKWVGQFGDEGPALADMKVLQASVAELLVQAPEPPLLAAYDPLDRKVGSPSWTPKPANDTSPVARTSWLRKLWSLLS